MIAVSPVPAFGQSRQHMRRFVRHVAQAEKLRDAQRPYRASCPKLSARNMNAVLTTASSIFKLASGLELARATLRRTPSAPSWRARFRGLMLRRLMVRAGRVVFRLNEASFARLDEANGRVST
jgi:hypothetical protein